ncbi:hypothetical protein GCM10017688_49190 [Streptomyces ramulosus]
MWGDPGAPVILTGVGWPLGVRGAACGGRARPTGGGDVARPRTGCPGASRKGPDVPRTGCPGPSRKGTGTARAARARPARSARATRTSHPE